MTLRRPMTMSRCSLLIRHLGQLADTLLTLGVDTIGFLRLWLRSPAALAAENLILRKQLALYQARHVKPKRATNATRFTLVWLSRWFDWQPALAIVQPETFSRWCRQPGGLGWFWKSQPGRPPIPMELQALIRQMARDNLTWGQRRIANELQLKLGLQVSPRTSIERQATARCPNAGGRSYATTYGTSSPVACLWTLSLARKPCLYASSSFRRGGGVTPSRMRGRGPLRVTLRPCLCCVGPCRYWSRGLRALVR